MSNAPELQNSSGKCHSQDLVSGKEHNTSNRNFKNSRRKTSELCNKS
jgi:hypothetical protein